MKKTLVLALAAIMVLGVAGAAFAGSATYQDTTTKGTITAAGPVAIQAKVNPKITLTLATPDGTGTNLLLDWTIDDPSATSAAKTVTLTTSSNKAFTITRTDSCAALTAAGINVSAMALTGHGGVKGKDKVNTDTVTLTPVTTWWDVEPNTAAYAGSLTYTLVQQ